MDGAEERAPRGVVVRRAGREDWAEYRAVRLRALACDPDAFGSTLAREAVQEDAFWLNRLERADATLLACWDEEDGARVVGTAVVAPSWTEASGAHAEAGLFGVWVAPEARGRGVGEALVHAAVEAARVAGYTRMVLEVADQNLPAVRLYARLGFAPTGNTTALPPPRAHITEHERALTLDAP